MDDDTTLLAMHLVDAIRFTYQGGYTSEGDIFCHCDCHWNPLTVHEFKCCVEVPCGAYVIPRFAARHGEHCHKCKRAIIQKHFPDAP